MANYNIIYLSTDNQHYLWNGSGFDMMKSENEKLMFSGKTYKNKELSEAIKKCREAIKLSFPMDADPQIKTVEIIINNKSNSGGQSPNTPS